MESKNENKLYEQSYRNDSLPIEKHQFEWWSNSPLNPWKRKERSTCFSDTRNKHLSPRNSILHEIVLQEYGEKQDILSLKKIQQSIK